MNNILSPRRKGVRASEETDGSRVPHVRQKQRDEIHFSRNDSAESLSWRLSSPRGEETFTLKRLTPVDTNESLVVSSCHRIFVNSVPTSAPGIRAMLSHSRVGGKFLRHTCSIRTRLIVVRVRRSVDHETDLESVLEVFCWACGAPAFGLSFDPCPPHSFRC